MSYTIIFVCLFTLMHSTFKFDTCIPQAEAEAHSRAVFAQVRFSGGARARGAVRARGAAGRARARASHATLVRRHYRHRTPLPSRSLTPFRSALPPACLPACLCAHELHQYWMHFNLSHIPVTLKVQCIGGGVMSCWMDFIQMIRLVYAEPNCTDNDDDTGNDKATRIHHSQTHRHTDPHNPQKSTQSTIHEKRVSRARIQFESF